MEEEIITADGELIRKRDLIIPKGTLVRVLDTKNVRRFNEDGIGYEFILEADMYKGQVTTAPGNRYRTNYGRDDLLILDKPIINQYPIF